MARLRILTLVSVLLSALVFCLKNRKASTIAAGKGLVVDKSWLSTNKHPLIPIQDRRPPDQTFLTYPEWFLVFSPKEQAEYFRQHTSTTFPYMKHVDQLWKGYDVVYHQIKGNYPFNTGYHVMIMVIGASTTVEYGLKAWYETVVGRVTDPGNELTGEDRLDQHYIADYVSFIENTPWYEYNFNHQLKILWTGTSFFGPHFLRKLERKYFLTTELLVKSGYGWLIKQGTKVSYEPALLNTTVVIDRLPEDLKSLPQVRNVRQLKNGWYLVDLPRYANFKLAVGRLASQGVVFKEIAGNNSAIMLTVLSNKPIYDNREVKAIFTQPIVTKAGLNRIALVTRVENLSSVVRSIKQTGGPIEHIYDY